MRGGIYHAKALGSPGQGTQNGDPNDTDPAMAGIDIHHPHQLSMPDARMAVQRVAEKLVERFGVECSWHGDELGFQRSGVDGSIALRPGVVHVSARLGFMLAAMQGPIESEIRRVLGKHFG
jgi:putative polyhydroxyalkanoate system protein